MILCLAIWTGSNEIYHDIKQFIDIEFNSSQELFGDPLIKMNFIQTLPKGLDECETLRKMVDHQKQALRLQGLPQRKLII